MWILKEISLPLPVYNCFSCVWLFATLQRSLPAPLSMGFSRQEYWSELPSSPPGSLLELGIEPVSLMSAALTGRFFTTSTTWEAPLFGLMLFSIWERRRQWHPTPVLLPGKSHGWRSLVGYVHGVAKSRTWLSDFTFTFHFHALKKEMATHSSVLAWRIPGTAEPGRLPSMGSHRIRHDWSNLAAAAASEKMNRFLFSVWICLPLRKI